MLRHDPDLVCTAKKPRRRPCWRRRPRSAAMRPPSGHPARCVELTPDRRRFQPFRPPCPNCEVETTRAGIAPHLVGRRVTALAVRQAQLRWPSPPACARLPGSASGRGAARQVPAGAHRRATPCCIWACPVRCACCRPARRRAGTTTSAGSSIRPVLRCTDPPLRLPALAGAGRDMNCWRSSVPEPLGEAFDGDYLWHLSRGRAAAGETVLMDQKIVVGGATSRQRRRCSPPPASIRAPPAGYSREVQRILAYAIPPRRHHPARLHSPRTGRVEAGRRSRRRPMQGLRLFVRAVGAAPAFCVRVASAERRQSGRRRCGFDGVGRRARAEARAHARAAAVRLCDLPHQSGSQSRRSSGCAARRWNGSTLAFRLTAMPGPRSLTNSSMPSPLSLQCARTSRPPPWRRTFRSGCAASATIASRRRSSVPVAPATSRLRGCTPRRRARRIIPDG